MQRVNKAELVRPYVEGGLTQGQVGEALGVTRQYVSLILKRENIPVDRKRHAKPKRIAIDRAILERLYVQERNSVERICEILGRSNTVVARSLKRARNPATPAWRVGCRLSAASSHENRRDSACPSAAVAIQRSMGPVLQHGKICRDQGVTQNDRSQHFPPYPSGLGFHRKPSAQARPCGLLPLHRCPSS